VHAVAALPGRQRQIAPRTRVDPHDSSGFPASAADGADTSGAPTTSEPLDAAH
jgi:hypothetical protein